jgi:vesicular inhibitory amino acid transporter
LTDETNAPRSSHSININALTQVGGLNSIENFARSWQRAAGFPEITPSISLLPDLGQADDIGAPERSGEASYPEHHRSLIRQGVEREGAAVAPTIDEESELGDDQEYDLSRQITSTSRNEQENAIIDQAPYLASSYASSYGGIYGSLSSRVNDSSMLHAARLFQEQQLQGAQAPDKETETLLVKRVEREDGRVVEVVVGQSTLPQTVFNSVNVLIGVGLLSLPLGLKYSGWLIGMIFLCSCAIVTKYTAGILAKCLTTNDSLVTFTDLAYVAFGTKGRLITSVLFCLELVGACVALVTLFADSLDAIIPGWGIVEWKIVCGLIVIPLSFVPLRLLSFTSVLGIISCFGSEHAPGGPAGSFSGPY